ncbi:hypothetical protein ACIOD1_34585 [Streptomyces sp. NPDC088097]|uniref:hypothetical protein n=1 Tax=Streptomyces sp. NPDC088097 TaxID=3365823 RepID=UPI00382712E2
MSGSWLGWGSVAQAAGATGRVTAVAMAGAGDEAHIVLATDNGTRQYHAVRNFNGTWTPLTELKGVIGTVTAKSVSAAAVNGEVQVAISTTGGQLLHTIRHTDRTWAAPTTVTIPGLPTAPGVVRITATWNP